MHLGCSILCNEWSQVISSQNIAFLTLNIDFVLANSADPDVMPHYATFNLDLHCLSKYPFRVLVYKGLFNGAYPVIETVLTLLRLEFLKVRVNKT